MSIVRPDLRRFLLDYFFPPNILSLGRSTTPTARLVHFTEKWGFRAVLQHNARTLRVFCYSSTAPSCPRWWLPPEGSPPGAHEGRDGGEARRGRLLAAGQRRLVFAEFIRRVPGIYGVQRSCHRRQVHLLPYYVYNGQPTKDITYSVGGYTRNCPHLLRRR